MSVRATKQWWEIYLAVLPAVVIAHPNWSAEDVVRRAELIADNATLTR